MAAPVRLLDLDGTLVLSYPAYARTLASLGPITERDALARLAGGTSIVRLAEGVRGGRARFVTAMRSVEVQLVPDWLSTLERLRQEGTPLGVVTSLPGAIAVPILEATHLAPLLNVVIHAGICRVPKPNPRSLLMAYSELGLQPTRDDLYVGDMPTDAAAAQAAGIGFAWASWGYGPDTGYDIVLDRPEALLNQ